MGSSFKTSESISRGQHGKYTTIIPVVVATQSLRWRNDPDLRYYLEMQSLRDPCREKRGSHWFPHMVSYKDSLLEQCMPHCPTSTSTCHIHDARKFLEGPVCNPWLISTLIRWHAYPTYNPHTPHPLSNGIYSFLMYLSKIFEISRALFLG
jgi:hypothetical protein